MAEKTAEVSQVLHASPAAIWRALTTPDLMKKYFLGADVESDFKPGSPITWHGEWKGKPFEDKGEILEVKPNQRLAFSHFSPMAGKPDAPENYHRLEFELQPQANDTAQTRVTLSQSNMVGGATASDTQHRAEYEKNWTQVLDGLKKVTETH